MRAWIIIIGLFGGLIALCWYGVTGETGPIGWLNSWQNGHTGSYSRGLSFGILCVALTVIGALALGLRALLAPPASQPSGGGPAAFTAPADAKIAAMSAAMTDRTRWRWRMYLKAWLVGLALVWAAVLGWHGWDYQRRAADARSDYTPLRLERNSAPPTPGASSHWALQGRLLWDRSAVQTTKSRTRETETVFVPVAPADWQPGDAVQFVLRLSRSEVWDLQHRAPAQQPQSQSQPPTLKVRVEGAVPTPSHAVFQKNEAPLAATAVLVELVDRSGGPVSDPDPRFDWGNARLVGAAISATWTAGVWLGALGVLWQVWRNNRRQGKAQNAPSAELQAGRARV